MQGFESRFDDIVDYILKITVEIWEGKQVGLCQDYYSRDCPVYTLAGVSIGADEVEANTAKTQKAFPDRTLDAVNIIWGGDDQLGFHTSHLIDTKMTAMGDSEFGQASEKTGRAFVIAHCICKDNRIIEEWLVRDNYLLATQFGVDPIRLSEEIAQSEEQGRLSEWRKSELKRLRNQKGEYLKPENSDNLQQTILETIHGIWSKAENQNQTEIVYDSKAVMHNFGGQNISGIKSIKQFFGDLHRALNGVKVSFDYVCTNSYKSGDQHMAVRWTLLGMHNENGIFGEPCHQEILILGENHYRLQANQIVEEWCVFDQLSVLAQVNRLRLKG